MNLIDTGKIGTLIISTYRSGTHFLRDYLYKVLPNSFLYGEIDSYKRLEEITRDSTSYKIAIVNKYDPKLYLLDNKEFLDQWHVICLTRKDKITQLISTYLWDLSLEGKTTFGHHGTDNQNYLNFVEHYSKIEFNIKHLKHWLLEHALIYQIPFNVKIDYEELIKLDPEMWNPNDYSNIRLEDLFTNHNEIKELLIRFIK